MTHNSLEQQVHLSPPPHFKPSLKVVGCLIQYKKSYLFVKRAPQTVEGTLWCLPGGKVEKGESLDKAVLREVMEETSIKIHPKKIAFFKTLYIQKGDYHYEFHVYHTQVNELPKVDLSDKEHTHFNWINFEEALQLPLIEVGEQLITIFQNHFS